MNWIFCEPSVLVNVNFIRREYVDLNNFNIYLIASHKNHELAHSGINLFEFFQTYFRIQKKVLTLSFHIAYPKDCITVFSDPHCGFLYTLLKIPSYITECKDFLQKMLKERRNMDLTLIKVQVFA